MRDVKVTVAARSDVGRVRKNNEDGFTITDLTTGSRHDRGGNAEAIEVGEKGVLLALSDGMGGHQAGEVASALALDSFRSAMRTERSDSIERDIEDAVRLANSEVVRAARAENKRGMGATLTAAFIEHTDAYIVEVGDSRAYLLRAGELHQLTRDQSLVQMLVDAGRLSPEEARLSPHKNVILQAMGLADDMHVAIGRLHLRRADTILICCDGLSNAITDDEMRQILTANEPTSGCARLIDLANERGGKDNLTAIVARLDGNGLPSASADESLTATFEVLRAFTAEGQR